MLARLQESRRLSRLDAVAQLGELRRRQGRLVEAEDLLQQAGYRPEALTSLAQLRLDDDEPERAWSIIAELLRTVPPQQLLDRVDALAVAVTAGLAVGRTTEAQGAAEELRRIATKVGTPALLAHADAGEARLAQERTSVERWQDAVRHFHAAGLTFDEAEARLELARALRTTGEEAAAHEQERSAHAALSPLRSSRIAGGVAGPLTLRQIEVLRLLARGQGNAEIAARLQLSEHTVHRHIANIYQALDLGSRAAAAAYAVSHGLS